MVADFARADRQKILPKGEIVSTDNSTDLEFQSALERAKRGSDGGFIALVGMHAGAVKSRARRLFGGRGALGGKTASDLESETWVKVRKNIAQFEGADRRAFGSWVGKLVDNLFLRWRWRNVRVERRGIERYLDKPLVEDCGKLAQLIRQEHEAKVRAVLELVDDSLAKAVGTAKLIGNRTLAEIAAELGEDERDVKAAWERCKRVLRRHLDERQSEREE